MRAGPFSFDATSGELPKTVVPISYSIALRPDAESLALPGLEVIDIEVREPTARLTFNAVNTTFASVAAQEVIAISAGLKTRALSAVMPGSGRANDGALCTILAKRCLAPAFPIAIAV